MGFSLKKIGKSIGGSLLGSTGTNLFDPLDIFGGTARDYNSAEAAKQRDWESAEAAKNREWQTQMSNTAHQRAMADLQAAGLNPTLAAQEGASTGSGGMASGGASASTQQNGGLADLASAVNLIISAKNAKTNAKNAESQRLNVEANNELLAKKIEDLENQIQNRNLNTAAGIKETVARINKMQEETQDIAYSNAKNILTQTSSKDPAIVKAVGNFIHYATKYNPITKSYQLQNEAIELLLSKAKNMSYNREAKVAQSLFKKDKRAYEAWTNLINKHKLKNKYKLIKLR